jgi:Trp operon repressor
MESNALPCSKDWERFLNLFYETKSKETLGMLFQLFLTQNEREMLVDRFRLVQTLLKSELPQREIAEQLKLSISKVTAGSKAVQSLLPQNREYLIRKMK